MNYGYTYETILCRKISYPDNRQLIFYKKVFVNYTIVNPALA